MDEILWKKQHFMLLFVYDAYNPHFHGLYNVYSVNSYLRLYFHKANFKNFEKFASHKNTAYTVWTLGIDS